MKNILFSFIFVLLASCQSKANTEKKEVALAEKQFKIETPPQKKEANSKEILKKPEVPVLCYHRIRKILPTDGPNLQVYSVTPEAFAEQMKTFSDNGYHTILPDQLKEYLVYGSKLPSKPVMITFDDTREEHYSIGTAEMNKYGFKGVFFIMTVAINRPGYMTNEQIKNLSDNGNVIGGHTWDHHSVTKYEKADWVTQLTKPNKKLESIVGKPIYCFAYPYGLWNSAAFPHLKENGYQLAFILSGKRDSTYPLYTIRRIIVSGTWSSQKLIKQMKTSFN
jgi:peptidoglycan/xylan/chitin deacetylase (PgdA/CDA1 family)